MSTAALYFASYLIVDALCIALTIVIASNISRDSGSETQVRYFFLVLTTFMVFEIFDAVWAFLAYSGLVKADYVLLCLVNGINLTAIAFAAYFWLCFTLACFNSQVTNDRRMRLIIAIPAILVPVLHVVGLFLGQNVIFSPDGTISYGFMHTVITAVSSLYIVIATAVAIRKYLREPSKSARRTYVTFIGFMVPFVVAGVVDTIVAGIPIAAACIMVSLVFVLTSMQDSRISSDALTGLNNRRRADEFLETSIAHVTTEKPLYLFIMDLDHFKDVNDTFGHLEGDRALKLMADALRLACVQTNAFAARWGGDEFVIICTEPISDPQLVSQTVKKTLKEQVGAAHLEYDLTCSIGYSTCASPSETNSEVISRADESLYEVKCARD